MSKTLLEMLVDQLPEWKFGDGEWAWFSDKAALYGGVLFSDQKPTEEKIPGSQGLWTFTSSKDRPSDAPGAVVARSQWLEARLERKAIRNNSAPALNTLMQVMTQISHDEWPEGKGEFACWSERLGCVITLDYRPSNPSEACQNHELSRFLEIKTDRPIRAESEVITRSAWLVEMVDAVQKDDDSWAEQQAERFPAYWRPIPAHWRYIDTYRINELFPVDDKTGAILHARKKLILAGVRTGGKPLDKDLREAISTLECKINN